MYNTVSNNNAIYSPLSRLQTWLDNMEIQEEKLARQLVKFIPSQCPFAKEIRLFNQVILRIPPLCKLNPCYDQLIGLRFRALCFLADKCNEDITQYCL